jgi:hypothetical protein
MQTFAKRRRSALILTLLFAGLLVVYLWAYSQRLSRSEFVSGWILFSVMLVLTAYNLRKKLPFFPLLRSSTWLQIHLYLGLLTIVIFLMHVGFRVPNGWLEVIIAALYTLVAGTGLLGIFLTRTFPKRLTVRGEEVLFERMPIYRRNLNDRAEKLVLDAVAETSTTTIADYYKLRLAAFFAGFRNYWHHLVESKRPRHVFETEFSDLDRYLSDRERQIVAELSELVYVKDDLDYQHALQKTLKGWLFVHLAATYSLLTFVMTHIVIVHAFSGGLR